jgi:hypothetical protein
LPPNFRRHLQGYELGLLTVAMVLTFALLTLPRASEPTTLPLPRIDRSEARQRDEHERELVTQAEREGLPFDVRAVGEALRRFGATNAQGLDAVHERQDVQERVRIALGKGQEPLLLRLRAVQTQFFLDALARFERERKPNRDLEELGGDFLAHAEQSGWFDDRGHCLADATTLAVLFRWRWSTLIDKQRLFPFAPTLNEWRIYFRFLLLHPERPRRGQGAAADDETRVLLVSALARRDPEYPESFAKGYLLYRLGNQEAAATEYRAHLGRADSQEYALLARNNLIYALQGVSSE